MDPIEETEQNAPNHRLLWSTISVLVLIAIAGIFYWQFIKESPSSSTTPNNQDQTAHWYSYKNNQYNYQIKYPPEYQINPQPTDTIISIPGNLYPKTNIGQATLSINLYFNTESACKNYTFNNSMIFPGKKITSEVLNSYIFYTIQDYGVAAGTAYKTKQYRIFRDNVCYEINLTMGIGNFDNYPPGTITRVDENNIWNRLDQVLTTFKFTK